MTESPQNLLSDLELITLATYDDNAHVWSDGRSSADFYAEELKEFAKIVPTGHILDGLWACGSGNGRDAKLLVSAQYGVTGIDISEKLLTLAASNCPQAHFQLANVYALPFADANLRRRLGGCELATSA